MTTKEIKEKAIAKAGEMLDNPGHWTSSARALETAKAVSELVVLAGEVKEQPSTPEPKTPTTKEKEK